MDTNLSSILESASSILILLPVNVNFDQVAAGLSLSLALGEEKDVSVSCPTPMRVEFNRLVGVNRVTTDLGNKNLVVRFVDYKANDIERVSYDIERGQFKLTVIPKPQVAPPTQEQVDFSYSGVNADAVILIGGHSGADFPALTSNELAGTQLIHIGTKSLTLAGKQPAISLARPGSSDSEVIAALIKESGFRLDADIATNLIIGIDEGSNHFKKGESVTADTFQVVADLMRAGGKRVSTKQVVHETYPPGAIPGQVVPQQKKKAQKAPKDWMEPKIYKGTSVS